MKEVIAVIRMNKMNETKKALAEAGFYSLTARKVMGRGKGKVDFLLLQGAEAGYEEAISQLGPGPKLIPKRLLNLALPDDRVEECVRTIIRVNQTGSAGDGKVFVRTLRDVVRIRTGEHGDIALDEALAPVGAVAE